jgi:cytosine/uracil/thiamine/allantoin permease
VPGFLVTVGMLASGRMPGWIVGMYGYAWFTGFIVAGGSYWLMMRAARLTYKEEVNYVPVN